MPEVYFEIVWPDGSRQMCYSPSSVVQNYFVEGKCYQLADFVARSRQALSLASDRVQQTYGYPCGLALDQLRQIEQKASQWQQLHDQQVQVLRFL